MDAPASPTRPETEPHPAYTAFAALTRARFPAYRDAMRGRVAKIEINLAERFVRSLVRTHFQSPSGAFVGLNDEIVAGAADDPELDGLGLVTAAFLAIRLGRFAEARDLAERAYAADQHETFAQRLALAADEESRELRLEVDDWLADRFCANPFTDVEVIGSGDAYTCCAAWLPVSIGSTRDPARENFWRGERAGELRRSILDGDFGYCSRLSCPRIAARTLPRRDEVTEPALRAAIDSGGETIPAAPRRVLLSYDTSCNLSCPSCRTGMHSLAGRAAEAFDRFYDDRIAPLVAGARAIKITGSGDPFGSNHFRRVLRKLTATPASEPRLQLQTNGVLFDARAFEELSLAGHVRSVWISVDAAREETYAVLRRGGDWNRLLANLEFLGRTRAAGLIGALRLDFVVQEANFLEMPAFVDLAARIGADGVHFLMLRNWGTFTPDEYRALAVAAETHPRHAELVALLADERFGREGVDLGNLSPLRKALPGPTPPVAQEAAV